ncbi:MAG TPA: aldo/keto reductase [Pseudonocardiaceae bacterium]|jgi:aryl-alcohol dehydrogenase-like predicted oxidoreductase
MTLRRLGRTSIEITPIGLGCMQFAGRGIVARQFYPATGEDVVRDTVRAALDGGVNWFDTAEMYGRGASEQALTSALRSLGREPGSVRIATKWAPMLRSAGNIVRTADARLGALQGYPIDLHQIHMPFGGISPLRAQVEAMARLCAEGKIGAVGVSNFSAAQLELAARVLREKGIELASNQVQINLLHREVERNGVLDAARRLGVTLIAYSPLASGVLTGKFHDDPAKVRALARGRRLLGAYRPAALRRSAPLIAELAAIAAAHGTSVAQVALSWLISFYGDSVVAIPGASRPGQAQQSAAAMELRLTDKELDTLDVTSARAVLS